MIPDYLTYLTKEDKANYLGVLSILLKRWVPDANHSEMLDEVRNEFRLGSFPVSSDNGFISYFSNRTVRVKKVVLIEVASTFHSLGIQSHQIKEFGHEIGLPQRESEVLTSWAEDYCEFLETGYMFINSKY